MRRYAMIHSSLFLAGVVGLGAVAAARALPYALPDDADLRIGDAARRFETHYDARFPVRIFGTNLWAALQYTVFDEGRRGVVVGEHQWLFTLEEFRGWPQAQDHLRAHLDAIADVDRRLQQRGTTLIVALVPAKQRLYGEHVGERMPAPVHRDLYGEARAALLARGVATPDLLRAMARCKPQAELFLRTDTHWTPAGALCAAAAIGEAVRRRVQTLPHRHYVTESGLEREHHGDLVRFLPLAPHFAFLLPAPDRLRPAVTLSTSEDDLLADTAAPEVALVGTSYSANALWNFDGALRHVLQTDVLNLAVAGRGPFTPMQDYLTDTALPPVRVLVWEIPERYLPMPQTDPAIPSEGGST